MEQIVFKRKVTQNGGSLGITLPPELIDFMELKESDNVSLVADSKTGKHLKLWNDEVPRTLPKRLKKKTEV